MLVMSRYHFFSYRYISVYRSCDIDIYRYISKFFNNLKTNIFFIQLYFYGIYTTRLQKNRQIKIY
jgi:hypothetical protein